MRHDMAKKVTEHPRFHDMPRKKGRIHPDRLDDGPNLQGMGSRHNRCTKVCAESIAPLRRYLASKVGTPWDEVYSELAQGLPRTKETIINAVDSLFYRVETNVHLVDGQPFDSLDMRVSERDFWVHPETGLLMGPTPTPKYRYKERKHFVQVPIDELHKYVRMNGIWYAVTFARIGHKPMTKKTRYTFRYDKGRVQPAWAFDIAFEKFPHDNEKYRYSRYVREWGAPIYAKSRRQVSSQVIRKVIEPALAAAAD